MRQRIQISLISVLCFLLFSGQSFVVSQSSPLLSGKVLKSSGSGDSPLARAQLELLDTRSGRVLQTAYSDPNGGFAFPGASPGQYDLQVLYGRILQQKTPQGWVEKRRVSLSRQPSRLVIYVRSR